MYARTQVFHAAAVLTIAWSVGAGCQKKEPPTETQSAATEVEPEASENLLKAKVIIDKMAVQFEQALNEVEAAGQDKAKVKAVGDKFKEQVDAMKPEADALNKVLSEDQRKQLEVYAKEKLVPLMGRLMQAMMQAQAMQLPTASTPPDAPAPEPEAAAPEPAAKATPEAAPQAAPAP